jgi:putative tryptophan/tyrosine transport system substrate-binding protein
MRRREFLDAMGGLAVTWPLDARAQQAEHVRRIGALIGTSADDLDGEVRLRAFVQGLRELDWIDGHNIRIDARLCRLPGAFLT